MHLVNIHGWRGYNNPWMAEEETDSEYSYINLLANPERYTGYKVAISIALLCSAPPLLVMGLAGLDACCPSQLPCRWKQLCCAARAHNALLFMPHKLRSRIWLCCL